MPRARLPRRDSRKILEAPMYTLLPDTPLSGSVVVGLDQSPGAKSALDWAADEAQLRGAPLRIAHSWDHMDYELPEAVARTIGESAFRDAAAFLDDTATHVRAARPGLKVDTVLLSEAPSEGLIGLAEDAALVVVGRRALNSVLSTLLGSVSQRLVAHAPVPVVVVPETRLRTAAPGPVVVGVARDVPAPLAFAFTEAERRGAPLLAVRAWTLPSPYIVASSEATASLDAEEDAELESLLSDYRTMHPKVHVTRRVMSAAPEEALLDVAEEAALIVLGRHRRHHRYGLPLGTVPHRVLHRADTPVAVVPN